MKLCIFALIFCVLLNNVFAQSGRIYRTYGVMDSNNVKTVFTNGGVLGHPVDRGPRGAWPYATNGYIGDFGLFVGARIETDSITFSSVEYCLADRRPNDQELSPTGEFWGFEPKSLGMSNLAVSSDPSTWPAAWSVWPYNTEGAIESYFEMDDNVDEEFNNPNYNGWGLAFKPDSTDPSRNGMGFKIESRYRQFDFAGLEDVLFMEHNLINEGTTWHKQVTFGGLMGTYVGMTGIEDYNEYNDDVSFFDIDNNYTLFWDYPMNNSRNPMWINGTGYASVVLAQSPGNPYDGIDNDRDNPSLPGSSAPYFTVNDFTGHTVQSGEQIVLIDENYMRSIITVPSDTINVTTCGKEFTLIPGQTYVVEGDNYLMDGIDNDFDGLIDENYYLHYDFNTYNLTIPLAINNTLGPTQYINYFTSQGLNDSLIDESGYDVDEIGLTSFYYFTNAQAPLSLLTNDTQLYNYLTPLYFNLPSSYFNGQFMNGEDGDYFFGSGIFPLRPAEDKNVILAIAYGETPEDLLSKVKLINSINYNNHIPVLLTLTNPTSGSYITPGLINIDWQSDNSDGKIILESTHNLGRTWSFIDAMPASQGTYAWDISQISESIFNKVRIRHENDPYNTILSSRFNIIGTGNSNPQAMFTESPYRNEMINGDLKVSWFAGDADGDSVFVLLEYSTTYSLIDTNWIFLADLPDSGSFTIDTRQIPNSNKALLKISAANNLGYGEDITHPFIIDNSYNTVHDTLNSHVAGQGSGLFEVHVVDSSQITGHQYEVTFNDSDSVKTYNVKDEDINQFVLTNCMQLDGSSEGPQFDGIRLLIDDLTEAQYDESSSRWSNPLIDLYFNVAIIQILNPNLTGYPFPFDYRIEFYDHVVDTSWGGYGAPPIQTFFKVINSSTNKNIDFIWNPLNFTNPDTTINHLDELYLFEDDENGNPQFGWYIQFYADSVTVSPQAEDTLFINTLKPFSSSDRFVFTTGNILNSIINKSNLPKDYYLSQNYPNPFNPSTTFNFTVAEKTDISLFIYDILGREVQKLIKSNYNAGTYKIVWNGKNKQGLNVASGIYFAVFKAENTLINRKLLLIR